MNVTRSSTRATAQHHKSLATLLWKLETSHCRCYPSLCSQPCTSSCGLAKWRTEQQQVPPKIGTYVGDACRRLSTVYCCCLWSLQLSTLWWPTCSLHSSYTLFSVWELSHTELFYKRKFDHCLTGRHKVNHLCTAPNAVSLWYMWGTEMDRGFGGDTLLTETNGKTWT